VPELPAGLMALKVLNRLAAYRMDNLSTLHSPGQTDDSPDGPPVQTDLRQRSKIVIAGLAGRQS